MAVPIISSIKTTQKPPICLATVTHAALVDSPMPMIKELLRRDESDRRAVLELNIGEVIVNFDTRVMIKNLDLTVGVMDRNLALIVGVATIMTGVQVSMAPPLYPVLFPPVIRLLVSITICRSVL